MSCDVMKYKYKINIISQEISEYFNKAIIFTTIYF